MTNSTTTCAAPDASGTTQCLTIYGQSSSTDPLIVAGFTAGEIVNGVFLFFIFTAQCAILFQIIFRKIKIKN